MTTNWTPENERTTLEAWAKMARAHDFFCTCCDRLCSPEKYGHTEMYRPRAKLIAQAIPQDNRGFYHICAECEGLPDAQRDARVLQALVKKGLMDPDVKNG
jgi:hypothetical protein